MKTEDLQRYKQRLLALRSRLRNDVNRMAGAVLEGDPTQPSGGFSVTPTSAADTVGDRAEREFALNLMETKDQILDQIEEALERIEDGAYGVCDACDGKIPKTRLNAIPYAVFCVECASRRETV